MWHIAGPVLIWYLVVQLVTLAALPLALRLLGDLPDHGYSLAKMAGVLAVGFVLWIGVSYSLLRNDVGGAWLAVAVVAAISLWSGRSVLAQWRRGALALSWRYVLLVEVLFAGVYLIWAVVRAYDPAANHTEQPMDLMFMNSIWSSATFPPQDAWLGGYAISYYYFGYWLLVTLGRLAGQPPAIAYNVGQACWYALLLLGSFSVVYNLLATPPQPSPAWGGSHTAAGTEPTPPPPSPAWGGSHTAAGTEPTLPQPSPAWGGSHIAAGTEPIPPPNWGRLGGGGIRPPTSKSAVLGGLLAAAAVGVTGNLQGILEWLYANGVKFAFLARWFDVHNFPGAATSAVDGVSGAWYIGFDWWWWRSSRVVQDLDLLGRHVEVIDEFPMFSYLLGDNHPHVLAMPVVLLVIGLAFSLLRAPAPSSPRGGTDQRRWQWPWAIVPAGVVGFASLVIAAGALVFLNTWDYPPYWLLLVICFYVAARRRLSPGESVWPALLSAALFGGLLLAGTFLVYLPYFLSAQSQAGGLLPNLFNPTRFPQFLLMFGFALAGVLALVGLAWRSGRPTARQLLTALGVTLVLPLLLLAAALLAVTGSEVGRSWLATTQLPPGATSHLPFVAQRWFGQPVTFLVVGALLALVGVLAWRHLHVLLDWGTRRESGPAHQRSADDGSAESLFFALLLAGIGLLLVHAPEYVYLRDNFGTRMNTVFKFYYQGWLLLSLATAYGVTQALRRPDSGWGPKVAGIAALLLILAGLIYPVAGVYSKTGGFASATPTLDATAYVAAGSTDEAAAVAWVNANVAPGAVVLEAKGASYQAAYNRISAMTGRPTLLGWEGHEAQWRGEAYARQAQGRPETIAAIYRDADSEQVARLLDEWSISYVYIGPTERRDYTITAASEERLDAVMDLVFQQGDVRIYRARTP